MVFLAAFLHGWLAGQTVPRPPDRVTYQGYLTGGDGVPLGNAVPRAYDLLIRILSVESGGTPLWVEQQTVTVDKGYFSLVIGEGASVVGFTNSTAGLGSVFQGATASDRFVGLTVRGIGSNGSDVEILPRVRLLSAPYAYLTQTTTRLVDASGSDAVTASSGGLTFANPIKAFAANTQTGAVGGITVTNTIAFSGSGGGSGGGAGFIQTAEGAVRLISGQHRWTGTNSAAYPGTANATLITEPSPGYSITRVSAGEYRIIFDTAFNSIPSVTATTILPAISYPAGTYWNSAWAVVDQSTDPTVACKQVTIRIFTFQETSRYMWQYWISNLGASSYVQNNVNAAYTVERNVLSYQVDWDLQFHAAGP
jgi:hypothetical protein